MSLIMALLGRLLLWTSVISVFIFALYYPQTFLVSCILTWAVKALVQWALPPETGDQLAVSKVNEHPVTDSEAVPSGAPPPCHPTSDNTLGIPDEADRQEPPRSPRPLYRKHASPEQVAAGQRKLGCTVFDPKAATKERRQRLKTKHASQSWSCGIDLPEAGDSVFQRNASIRKSNRGSRSGSCGDLEEMAKEAEDDCTPLPNIKIWSSSCGNLQHQHMKERRLKDCVDFVDSWDGLHQILGEAGKAGDRTASKDEKAALSGSSITLHYHWGPIVHMDHSSEVQIGNNSVMKRDKQAGNAAESPPAAAHSAAGEQLDRGPGHTTLGASSEDLAVDGMDMSDDEVDDPVQYEVDEDPGPTSHRLDRCEKSTSYHDPMETVIRQKGTSWSLERGTSYHDPTADDEILPQDEVEDVPRVEQKDMATGTTMSLLRGACLQEVGDADPTQDSGGLRAVEPEWRYGAVEEDLTVASASQVQDDVVFLPDSRAVGGGKLTYEGKKAKLIEEMRAYRRLKSQESEKTKKKGFMDRLKRKKST